MRRLTSVMVALLLLAARPALADPIEIRLATLLPRGSLWARTMEAAAVTIEKRTEGRVRLRFYFSGLQGDERDVLRKIRLGQLDGGVFSAVGLGLIHPHVRVLELPFLFASDREVDHVRERLAPELEKGFEDAGYVLLAWGDAGWSYLYGQAPIGSLRDLARGKTWLWQDDPISKALFDRLALNGVPMGPAEVLPALQTRVVDSFFTTPLAAVAMQWHTRVSAVSEQGFNYRIGAVLVRRETFARLAPEDQKVVRQVARALGADLIKLVRRDNERAARALEKVGIRRYAIPAAVMEEARKQGLLVWRDMAGKLYPEDLLERVKASLAEARGTASARP